MSIGQTGLIAATRGILGAGIGLLLAGKLSDDKRKKLGVPLLVVGVLTTIPIAISVATKLRDANLPVRAE